MAGLIDLHEGEVARRLELAVLLLGTRKSQIRDFSPVERLLAWPLESLGPGLVAKPIADKISITGVDENRDLFENARDKAVEWLHPVALEEEVAVDVKVAAVVGRDLSSKGFHDGLLVQIVADVAQPLIAKVTRVLALATDVVNVLTSALVGTHHGIVAVDRCGHTAPHTAALVAVVDQRLAARKGVVHATAFAFVKDRRIPTLAAGHWAVVFVLSVAISQAVADQNGLEVDVAVLVREDLRGKDRNIMTGI